MLSRSDGRQNTRSFKVVTENVVVAGFLDISFMVVDIVERRCRIDRYPGRAIAHDRS
jgi:hypothetical protein